MDDDDDDDEEEEEEEEEKSQEAEEEGEKQGAEDAAKDKKEGAEEEKEEDEADQPSPPISFFTAVGIARWVARAYGYMAKKKALYNSQDKVSPVLAQRTNPPMLYPALHIRTPCM